MRSVVLVLVACSVHLAHAAPGRDSRGWCPTMAAAKRAGVTKSFEVTRDLRKVSPMRKVTPKRDPQWRDPFTSFQGGFARDSGARHLGASREVTIVGNKLRIATFPRSCQHLNRGCFPGETVWTPGEVQLEEDVGDACISYVGTLGRGFVVGVGTQMRTYELREDGSVVAGPRVTTPVLEGVEGLDDGVLLQEPKGGLWIARWEKAPTLTKVNGVARRVRGFVAMSGTDYAYTDDALYVLDEKTMSIRWKVPGEVWSAIPQDVPPRHFVLTIERGAKSRVVVRMVDEKGTEVRRVVVYEGTDIIEAHLESTYIPAGTDEVETLYLVHIATT